MEWESDWRWNRFECGYQEDLVHNYLIGRRLDGTGWIAYGGHQRRELGFYPFQDPMIPFTFPPQTVLTASRAIAYGTFINNVHPDHT